MREPIPGAQEAPDPDQTRWFLREVHPHDAALRSYMRGCFATLRDLDDVVQESYLRVWKRQAARPIQSIKGFLFTVARNLALDHLRHQQSSPVSPDSELLALAQPEGGPTVEEIAAFREEFELVLQAIESLPRRCREVVISRKLCCLSAPETARKLGISEETVHVHARRGLRRIQETLLQRGVIRGKAP